MQRRVPTVNDDASPTQRFTHDPYKNVLPSEEEASACSQANAAHPIATEQPIPTYLSHGVFPLMSGNITIGRPAAWAPATHLTVSVKVNAPALAVGRQESPREYEAADQHIAAEPASPVAGVAAPASATVEVEVTAATSPPKKLLREDLPKATTNVTSNHILLFPELLPCLEDKELYTFFPYSELRGTVLTPAPPGPRTGSEHAAMVGRLQVKLSTNLINALWTFMARRVGIRLKYFERTDDRRTAYLFFETFDDLLLFHNTYRLCVLEDVDGVWIELNGGARALEKFTEDNATEIKRSMEDGVERHGLAYHPVGKPMSVERAKQPKFAVGGRPHARKSPPAAAERQHSLHSSHSGSDTDSCGKEPMNWKRHLVE